MINAVQQLDRLDPGELTAVLELARAASNTDGAYPLSEHTVLQLRHGGDVPVAHLLAKDTSGELLGYAHVDTTDRVTGPSAELVVHPLRRRKGLGRTLVTAAAAVAAADPQHRLRLWAHGDHPSASALALSLGFARSRVLLQLRRSLFAQLPEAALPAGMSLRAFQPGRDEQDWLELNRQAFAGHPEQGRWTADDLDLRMAESWFDPAGFLLAERDGKLVGFHWTKVHGRQHDPIGEVYVLGVDPDAHGLGLGRALTLAGLRHLRAAGLDQVMLYVDESNAPAVALYERLGFARWAIDVLFTRSDNAGLAADAQQAGA